VHSSLPDFLGDPTRTGRGRLPQWRLRECFAPAAETWLDLSKQVARLVEQAAWLLLERAENVKPQEVAGDVEVEPELHEKADGSSKGTTRRQRKQAVARRRDALAAEALVLKASGTEHSEDTEGQVRETQPDALHPDEAKSQNAAVTSGQAGRDMFGTEESIASASGPWQGSLLSGLLESGHHPHDDEAPDHTPGREMYQRDEETEAMETVVGVLESLGDNPQEADALSSLSDRSSIASWLAQDRADAQGSDAMALHLCEINTASWSSRVSIDAWAPCDRGGCPPLAGIAWDRGCMETAARDSDDLHLREINAASWSSRGSEAAALNMCEVNTASWSSRGSRAPWMAPGFPARASSDHVGRDVHDPEATTEWYLREANASSWSSRGSVSDAAALNLCEVNTASWSSTASKAARFASYHARSVQELMHDLSMHGAAASSAPSAPHLTHGTVGYNPLGKPAESAEDAATPPMSQAACSSGAAPPGGVGAMLPGLDTASTRAKLPVVEAFPTFAHLDELVGPEEFRERRHDNLRWRIWAVAGRRGTHPVTLAAGDAAGGPALPPTAWAKGLSGWMQPIDELHPLCVRETRWENRFMRAARRVADLESGQRVCSQRPQQLWQQSHGSRSPTEHRWHWERKQQPRTSSTSPPLRTSSVPWGREHSPTLGLQPRTSSPSSQPLRTSSVAWGREHSPSLGLQPPPATMPMTSPGTQMQAATVQSAEDHVLVAVPVSRLEAVARVLTSSS